MGGITGTKSTGFSVGLPLGEAFDKAIAFWQKEKAEIEMVQESEGGSQKKFTAIMKLPMGARFTYILTFRGEAKITNILAGVTLTNAWGAQWGVAIQILKNLSKALGFKQNLKWGEDSSVPSSTKKCPVCGAQMPAEATSCPECNEPLG